MGKRTRTSSPLPEGTTPTTTRTEPRERRALLAREAPTSNYPEGDSERLNSTRLPVFPSYFSLRKKVPLRSDSPRGEGTVFLLWRSRERKGHKGQKSSSVTVIVNRKHPN